MRLLSLNVWGGQLLDELLKYLSGVDADVYCLQEVFDAQVSMTTNMFEIMPRVRIDLFNVLCEHLSGHRGFFTASCEKFPHDPAVGDIPVPYGVATFVRKGISVTRHRAHFVHGEFSRLPRGELPFPRVGHALTVYDRAHDQPITIAHMHGLWDADGKRDTPERARQAILFRLLLSGLQVSGKRIACGDWNVLPRGKTSDLLEEIGLHDLVTSRGFMDTRTSHYPKKSPRYADYMFASSDITVQHFDVVSDPEVSDHRPLLLDFE